MSKNALLNLATSPLVIGIIFFLVVLPIGLVLKLFKYDPLKLKFDKNKKSYWITRDPPGPAPSTQKNQF